jgi:hypothetical protein
MTVMSLTGSSLEDVWGPAATAKQRRKRRSADNERECEVLAQNAGFDDIMDNYYSPSIYGQHEKARFSRTQKPLPDTDADSIGEREPSEIFVDASKVSPLPQPPRLKEDFTDGSARELARLQYEREQRYMDLGMYVFSGVALIFILEQFINLGVALKA